MVVVKVVYFTFLDLSEDCIYSKATYKGDTDVSFGFSILPKNTYMDM